MRPTRLQLGRNNLGVEHQGTPLVGTAAIGLLDRENALTGGDESPDDPIDRSTVQNLVGTARRVAGEMPKLAVGLGATTVGLEGLERIEVGYPNREFEQVHGHV